MTLHVRERSGELVTAEVLLEQGASRAKGICKVHGSALPLVVVGAFGWPSARGGTAEAQFVLDKTFQWAPSDAVPARWFLTGTPWQYSGLLRPPGSTVIVDLAGGGPRRLRVNWGTTGMTRFTPVERPAKQ